MGWDGQTAGGPRRALTLVAVRQEEGARAHVVAVEAVDGHGRVLARAAPEPAHGGRRALPPARPSANPEAAPPRAGLSGAGTAF